MKKLDKIFYIIISIITSICFFVLIFFDLGFSCPIKKVFHIYCPACGVSRMFMSLFDGNIYQAFRYNPLIFILCIIFVLFFIVEMLYFINKKKFIKINDKVYIILIITFILFTILRNIEIFSFLAPTLVN